MCLQQKNYNQKQHLQYILKKYNKKLHKFLDIVDENSAQVTEQNYMEAVNFLMERHKSSKPMEDAMSVFETLPHWLKQEADDAIHKEMQYIEILVKRYQDFLLKNTEYKIYCYDI